MCPLLLKGCVGPLPLRGHVGWSGPIEALIFKKVVRVLRKFVRLDLVSSALQLSWSWLLFDLLGDGLGSGHGGNVSARQVLGVGFCHFKVNNC